MDHENSGPLADPGGGRAGKLFFGAPSLRDFRGGYRLILDPKTLDRLAALRDPGESYSDVIIRPAKAA
jgi:hypothetical protein